MVQKAISDTEIEPRRKITSNITYFIGSGLTNATASKSAYESELVMGVLFKDTVMNLRNDNDLAKDPISGPLINQLIILSDKSTVPNLEELIDLLESSGQESCIKLSQALSSSFANVLIKHTKKLIKNGLSENMAEILLDLHCIEDNSEPLVGIITTNYDPFIEMAFESIGIDTDLAFETSNFGQGAIPLLKIHGSIDWIQSVPIKRRKWVELGNSHIPSWIGPRRLKLGVLYPFNLIWGRARELLAKTDVIRIVGASLLPSDWHIAQLLFRTTVLDSQDGRKKRIEVINSVSESDRICRDYPMLPIKPIYKIDDVMRNCRTELSGTSWNKPLSDVDRDEAKHYVEKIKNPFDYWVQSKIQMLLNSNKSLHTKSGKLWKFASNTYGESYED